MGPCILRITDEFPLINVLDCVGNLVFNMILWMISLSLRLFMPIFCPSLKDVEQMHGNFPTLNLPTQGPYRFLPTFRQVVFNIRGKDFGFGYNAATKARLLWTRGRSRILQQQKKRMYSHHKIEERNMTSFFALILGESRRCFLKRLKPPSRPFGKTSRLTARLKTTGL